ncbi:aldo/keto reductase [Desulfohalovibrio reitneri]|uniref:aldo/keto reductase n=1 Tax=Desulfohalovibrio reitneri TaxID=1307759 RepID=UPI0005595D30|nr:aldo/keto reductase [Desulfohalovibrio reitneri]
MDQEATALPTTPFGHGGPAVTRVGLGGEGVLRTFGEDAGARSVIREARKLGVTYFDTAPAYSGSQSYLGAYWREHPGERERVFHTSKSARRDHEGALADLRDSLERLGTDHLDLWQIHDVRTQEDVERIAAPDGALAAFLRAREEGRAGRIGVTGHHDPEVLLRCVEEWPLDAVLLPVNPVEGALGGFLDKVLPAARAKGMAVVGMKVFGGGHYLNPKAYLTPTLLLRYALSQDIDVAIIGCGLADHVRTMAEIAAGFQPMPPEAQEELLDSFRPHAARMVFYRGVT